MKLNLKKLQESIKNSKNLKGDTQEFSIINKAEKTYFVKKVDKFTQFISEQNVISGSSFNLGLEENFTTILSKIKNENDITFSDDRVTTEKREIKFNNVDTVDILEYTYDEKISLPTEEFKQLMQVVTAAAKDDTRPILQGVSFKDSECCALDGYRLSLRKGSFNLKNQYVIKSDLLKVARELIQKKTKEISIEFNKENFKITIDNNILISDLIEDDFISYSQIIPKDFITKINLNTKEVLDELSFINDVNTLEKRDKTDKTVKPILFHIVADEVVLRNQSNTAKVTLEGTVEGEEITIGFNPKYIKEALQGSKNNFTMNLNNSVHPCIITSDEFNGLELVLPVRLAK